MKKTVFYLLVMLIACTFTAQSQCDTVYPPEHLNDYILPSALIGNSENVCTFSVYEPFDPFFQTICIGRLKFFGDYSTDRYTLAVPYYSDTLISIYGVSIAAWHINTDANVSVKFQIRDSIPDNVLRNKDASSAMQSDGCYYTEIFFDNPITVQGLYHVAIECNGIYEKYHPFMIGAYNMWWQIQLVFEECGRGCVSDYPALFKSQRDSLWHNFDTIDQNNTWSPKGANRDAIFLMFPIKGDLVLPSDTVITDTASSALGVNILNEESVRVYPNPASDVLNVASDYNILNIAIFDAMNRLVEEREVNAKNVRINIAKRPSGVYFIKVRTDRGYTMRKFVIR
mgnify:FL=1